MVVLIDPSSALERLVVIASGTIDVIISVSLKHMYPQSGAALQPHLRQYLKAVSTSKQWLRAGLPGVVREERDNWIAAMPADFQPGNVQRCCCSACPECLVRGGVPILSYQAWTNDGFVKHVMPH